MNILRIKFKMNLHLAVELMKTENEILVYLNYFHKTFWDVNCGRNTCKNNTAH